MMQDAGRADVIEHLRHLAEVKDVALKKRDVAAGVFLGLERGIGEAGAADVGGETGRVRMLLSAFVWER